MQQKWSHHVKEISIPATTRTQCWGVPHILGVRARGWPGGGNSLLSFPQQGTQSGLSEILRDQILSVYKGVGENEDENKWGLCGDRILP